MRRHRRRSRPAPCVRRAWAVLLSCALSWAVAGHAAVQPDVRVLIDVSGSMKQTDPRNLRVPSLRLLTGMLPVDSRAGVWTFGRYVNMLVPYGPVDAEWRGEAARAAAGIGSVALYTDIESALRTATWNWHAADAGTGRHLILLTDGRADVPGGAEASAGSRERIARELLPRLQAAGAAVHTIALSGDADEALLRQLAAATGGRFERADNAEALERVLLRMFDRAVQPVTLPLADREVLVGEGVRELTVLMFRREGSRPAALSSPDGSAYGPERLHAGMRWHRDERYDLVTIERPQPGAWRIDAEPDPDSRVMIVSDLELAAERTDGRPLSFRGAPLRIDGAVAPAATAPVAATAVTAAAPAASAEPATPEPEEIGADESPGGPDWTRIGLAVMLANLLLGALLFLAYRHLERRTPPSAAAASGPEADTAPIGAGPAPAEAVAAAAVAAVEAAEETAAETGAVAAAIQDFPPYDELPASLREEVGLAVGPETAGMPEASLEETALELSVAAEPVPEETRAEETARGSAAARIEGVQASQAQTIDLIDRAVKKGASRAEAGATGTGTDADDPLYGIDVSDIDLDFGEGARNTA